VIFVGETGQCLPPRIDLGFTGTGAVPVSIRPAAWAETRTALIAHDPHGQREENLLGGEVREIEHIALQEYDIEVAPIETDLGIDRGGRRRPIINGKTLVNLPGHRFEAPGTDHRTLYSAITRDGEKPVVRAHLTFETDPHGGRHLVAVESIRIDAELLVEPPRILPELGHINLHAHTSPRREREYSIYVLLIPGLAGCTRPPGRRGAGFRVQGSSCMLAYISGY